MEVKVRPFGHQPVSATFDKILLEERQRIAPTVRRGLHYGFGTNLEVMPAELDKDGSNSVLNGQTFVAMKRLREN
jgi:hypothetical protein